MAGVAASGVADLGSSSYTGNFITDNKTRLQKEMLAVYLYRYVIGLSRERKSIQ